MAKQNGGNSSAAVNVASTTTTQFRASIFSSGPIDPEFGALVNQIAELLGAQVWLLVQSRQVHPRDAIPFDSLGFEVAESFKHFKAAFPKDKVVLLIDSPGGDAKAAYQLAKMLRRQTRISAPRGVGCKASGNRLKDPQVPLKIPIRSRPWPRRGRPPIRVASCCAPVSLVLSPYTLPFLG